jgi:uncharacterized protein
MYIQPLGEDSMHVAQLWRYPVKSLRGEPLNEALLTPDGIQGDRVVHVCGPRGPLTGRGRHGLLTVPVETGPDGAPWIAGHRWDSPASAEAVRAAGGPDASLRAYEGPERFDILNLLVATDGAVTAWGHDLRRLRPNLVLAGVAAGAEASWVGKALAIGDTLIGVHSPRERCVVTSIDPDTGAQDLEIFRKIRRDFGGKLALNCWVARPGPIRVGDPVQLVACDFEPEHLGGWIVGAPYRSGC